MKPKKTKIIIETQYLPTIAFFSYLYNASIFQIERNEHYQKGSFRNRALIMSSQGALLLSIPLKNGKNSQQKITDVLIDNDSTWNINHLRSIKSCYGKSPYFDFYFSRIKAVLDLKHNFLFDLNLSLINTIINLLNIEEAIEMSTSYLKKMSVDFEDKRNTLSPKTKDGRIDSDFNFKQYDQVFSDQIKFEPNLSILDLLFCLGPEAPLYLKSIYNKSN